jgi:hypothetical protein
MNTWKRAVAFGAVGVGAALLLKGKRPAGVAATTVGLAILASEYPETFEAVWEHVPEYVTRGMRIFQTVSEIAQRLAERTARPPVPGSNVA